MEIKDLPIGDEAFKAAVLETGLTNPEDVIEIRARKQKIKSVDGLECFPNLKLLDLTRNQLTEIDVSQNLLLEELYLGSNELEELDVSHNNALRHLEIFINDIESLNLEGLTQLENVYASKNDLVELNLSGNPLIDEIQLSHNEELNLLMLPENHVPFIVKAENTQLDEDVKAFLTENLASHNLKI